MAQLQRSAVCLRICGDDLVPEEITRLLGVAPSKACVKGEKIVGKKTGFVRIAKSGMWLLGVKPREPEDIDGQIHEILSQMTDDLAVWRGIAEKYKVDLFCGLFLKGSNEGLTLSPQSLAALGNRGIEMGLDVYSGQVEPEEKSTEPATRTGA